MNRVIERMRQSVPRLTCYGNENVLPKKEDIQSARMFSLFEISSPLPMERKSRIPRTCTRAQTQNIMAHTWISVNRAFANFYNDFSRSIQNIIITIKFRFFRGIFCFVEIHHLLSTSIMVYALTVPLCIIFDASDQTDILFYACLHRFHFSVHSWTSDHFLDNDIKSK